MAWRCSIAVCIRQEGNDGGAALYPHPRFDLDEGVGWQVGFRPGAKADETDFIAPADMVSLFKIADNPPRNQSGNLPNANRALRGFKHNQIALIRLGGFLPHGAHETAGTVPRLHNAPISRGAVDMDVKYGKKNPHLDRLATREGGMLHLLHHINPAIRRGNQRPFLAGRYALRVSEEKKDEEGAKNKDRSRCPPSCDE